MSESELVIPDSDMNSSDSDVDMEPSSSTHNPNPTGKNQHKTCPPANDPHSIELLVKYHKQGITDRAVISQLLAAEGIAMSPTTVGRRRAALGLKASGAVTRDTPELVKAQLVLDQMSKDPKGLQGPTIIREGIIHDTGIHLTRDYVSEQMRLHSPDGFAVREPSAKRVHRVPLTAMGPNDEWSGDGHDKLVKIGFPIWGIRDKWSGKWLGLWVVPDNRLKVVIAYLYLSVIEELGGMPIQTTTDCSSETTRVYGLANALREMFSPEISVDEVPAHQFLKSINNTTIERGWLRFRLQWGDNAILFWNAGEGIYNPSNRQQFELVRWLWPMLIQKELDALKEKFNNHPVRKDKNKLLPSGVAPNISYVLYEKYGGEDCLQPVDRVIIQNLKKEIGGADLIRFVGLDYAARAEEVFNALHIQELTFDNVWQVYSAMLPLMPVS